MTFESTELRTKIFAVADALLGTEIDIDAYESAFVAVDGVASADVMNAGRGRVVAVVEDSVGGVLTIYLVPGEPLSLAA